MSELSDYLKAKLMVWIGESDDPAYEQAVIAEITDRGSEVEIAFDGPKRQRTYLRFDTAELLAAIPLKKRSKP